jgi:SAM-dependent methyltransferase
MSGTCHALPSTTADDPRPALTVAEPVWFHGVAEREHELQNPTSAEKIRLLGQCMRLTPASRVLDVASGRGGPARVLAQEFGCRIACVERFAGFARVAEERAQAARLDSLITVVTSDAREVPLDPAAYDAALCLGASFIWDGLGGTLAALLPAVCAGGYVAVGEPYWRTWPVPDSVDDGGYLPLFDTVSRFEAAGLAVISLIASSTDDWDRYESLHWQACEEWLAENEQHPDATRIRSDYHRYKEAYLSVERDLLGWAIFVGWKRNSFA